jgi:hypothetical protein
MKHRYGTEAVNYRFGNPLIGMSLSDITPHVDTRNQMGLFSKNPLDVLKEVRQMYRHYFSLSDKIREDMALKEEIASRLNLYCERIRDIMDLVTATYFSKAVDERKIQEAWPCSMRKLVRGTHSRPGLVRRGKAHRQAQRLLSPRDRVPLLVDGAFD